MMKKLMSKLSPKAFGVIVLVLFLLTATAAFGKQKINTLFSFGDETLAAEFSNKAKLIGDDLTYDHVVKMNGVVIGKVTTIDQTNRGTMIAHMIVQPGIRAKLGSAPTAFIIPTLVTDGVQYLGLKTGGDPGQTFTGDLIPLERTKLPVYLDDVIIPLSAEKARKGVQAVIGQTDGILREGGGEALRNLVTNAPQTLRPTGVVLNAVRGTNPETDLTSLVQGLESISQALNQQRGQFSSTVTNLNRTMQALRAGAAPLAAAVATLPSALQVSRVGFADLRPALKKLERTGEDFRPSARQLDSFLHHFGPVLHKARPVIHDLREVLHDARPLVHQLPETADRGNNVLNDVKGAVFDRVNGPIKDRIYSPFRPSPHGEYRDDGSDIPTYKELGYFISAFDAVFQHYDANNGIARLEAGGGGQSLFGGRKFPKSIEQYFQTFGGLNEPPGPNPGLGNKGGGLLGKPQPRKADPKDNAQLFGPNTDLPMMGG